MSAEQDSAYPSAPACLALCLLSATACAGKDAPPLALSHTASPAKTSSATAQPSVSAPVVAAPPPCESPAGAAGMVISAALTPRAEMLVVLRRGGCLETWDIAKRSRIAVQQGSKEATWVLMAKGPVAVTGGDRGYAVPSLAPAEVPAAEPLSVIHEDGSVGIAGLDPALSKALAKWAAKSRVTLRTEASRTWLTPKLMVDGEIRDLDLTADGKLLADNGELVRLDTGKHARFNAWTKSFTAMSDETFDAAVQVSFGPRSDRAVVQSVARMGAGPEVGSAILVDTGTMKQIGTLEATCQPNEVAWSPGGSWIVREPCDGGVLADHLVAVDSATGKVRRELPSKSFGFAEDDHTVVCGAVVLDLTTGARVFALPDADAP